MTASLVGRMHGVVASQLFNLRELEREPDSPLSNRLITLPKRAIVSYGSAAAGKGRLEQGILSMHAQVIAKQGIAGAGDRHRQRQPPPLDRPPKWRPR